MTNRKIFKTCSNCRTAWPAMHDLLEDPEIELIGYQVAFNDLTGGLFYFNHLRPGCGTTLAVPVGEFTALSSRPIVTARTVEPHKCSGLCVRRGELDPCPVECECTWVREVIQTIRAWKKKPAALQK